MKKSILHIILLSGVALVIGACQKGLTPEEQKAIQEQEKAEKTEQFWDVVGQLVAASDVTEDYKGKTFEPMIGIADASDSQARIVKSNSAAAAARSFADLVNVYTITEQTPSYIWRNPEVGTLTYTKTDGTSSWAEVKVEIPSIPHLSKIIYRSVEQSGNNGSFSYAAYYRFGDVVKRNNDDGKEEYWVCVRPAFGPEGKEDSHWMCVGSLPSRNLWSYTASNDVTYVLPTKLDVSKEHMQNFAEMLFAMCYPEEWQTNVFNYSKVGWTGPYGLPIFHDFSSNNAQFHNKFFWSNVAQMWKDKGLGNAVLGTSLERVAQELKVSGIHFLYKGYSWWTGTSNSATLYQAKYVNTPDSEHANMQTASPFLDIKRQMVKNKNEQDNIKEFTVKDRKYVINLQFFGDESPRYIVRYAKGSDLASNGKMPAVDQAIPGVEDVYRYYKDVLPVKDLKAHAPEITKEAIVNDPQKQNFQDDFNGTGYYTLGNIYEDDKGDHWIVINMAGQGPGTGDARKRCEPAPVAELISFDGLSVVDRGSGKIVADLPTFAQSVRGATYLRLYYGMGRGAFAPDLAPGETSISMRMVKHIYQNLQWNLLDMVQATVGWGESRNLTHAFSVAYADPDVSDSKMGQPLFRLLYPTSLDIARPPYFIWKHYPKSANVVTKQYGRDAFGDVPILLQDIADKDKVGRYADDFYATQPLEANPNTTRDIRIYTDSFAYLPQTYFYTSATWKEHFDMWNEPVLMFRMDAVYDRGSEYSTRTIKGRNLKPVAVLDEFLSQDIDKVKDGLTSAYLLKGMNNQDWLDNTFDVDGNDYYVPNWSEVWNK